MKQILFFSFFLVFLSCGMPPTPPNKNAVNIVDSSIVDSDTLNIATDTLITYCINNLDKYIQAEKIIRNNKTIIMNQYFLSNPKDKNNNTIYDIILDKDLIKKILSKNNSKEFDFLLTMFENRLVEPTYSIEFWEKQRNTIVFSVKDDSPKYIYSIVYDPDSVYSQIHIHNQIWLNPKWKLFGYRPSEEY